MGLCIRHPPARFLNVLKKCEDGIVIMAHALGVVYNDFFHLGAGGFEFQHFVGLLLVTRHQKNRIRVVDDILYLFQVTVRIDTDNGTPQCLNGQFGV